MATWEYAARDSDRSQPGARSSPPDEAGSARSGRGRHHRWAPVGIAAGLSGVYGLTLLPGPGYSPDTAEMQFAGPLLCVTHPTGYPLYLLLLHGFSRLIPAGSMAFRANLFSAFCSVLACLVVRRLCRRVGAREAIATSAALALGLTPTFWRMSIVAEVYSLHALFLALVADALLKWRQSQRRRDLFLAAGLYVAAFGNHLTAVTLLPAFAFLLVATRWRVVLDTRAGAGIATLVALGLIPYAYPLWRSLDPSTPYVSVSVDGLADLWHYVSGAGFRDAMFAFGPAQLLSERVPLFFAHWWADCGVLLPFAALGLTAFKDRVAGLFLGLLFLGHMAFALTYDIPDIDVYFIPAYVVTAVAAAVGLERLFCLRPLMRVPAAVCLALPLTLAVLHGTAVEQAKGSDKAEEMRALLGETRESALIIARYNDFMYLLYFTLAEGLGGPGVFVANELSVEEIIAYLEQQRPVYLAPLRKWAPLGLPVYCTRLALRPALRDAGLRVEMIRPGIFRIYSGGQGSPP